MHDESTDLQGQILRYLQRNAHAAETPEGVNRVWLRRPHTPPMIAEVESALNELVRLGNLEKHHLPGSIAVYRLVQDTPLE